ncbi:MAG TPA: SDR family oxidoreductase [Kofleriaceae bacterium]|nr:SDR family oxidoreductase [Kofleriaceae bacterium]
MTGRGGRLFITGGAGGLGRALAARYGRDGWRVCIGDVDREGGVRTAEALSRAGADVHFLACDVTRDRDLEAAAAWVDDRWGGVDVVVNNAGVAVAGPITEVPLADWQWIVDINLLGVVRGCRAFVPLLRRAGGGHLVNIASLAGLVHAPFMAPYNASKAAVVALSETLRAELAPSGVQVHVVCPSFFRTGIAASARTRGERVERLAHGLVGGARLGPDEIADRIHRGVARGRFLILTHPEGRALSLVKRWAPSVLAAGLPVLARRLQAGSAPRARGARRAAWRAWRDVSGRAGRA